MNFIKIILAKIYCKIFKCFLKSSGIIIKISISSFTLEGSKIETGIFEVTTERTTSLDNEKIGQGQVTQGKKN